MDGRTQEKIKKKHIPDDIVSLIAFIIVSRGGLRGLCYISRGPP